MISTSGIWSHTTAQSMSPTLTPMDSSNDGSDGSTGDSATISANDFLTLLVTEMQNQDPTADTDPNEYINQLVNVNSLEQLININQTLSTVFGGSTGASGSTGTSPTGDAAGPSSAIQQTTAGSSAGSMNRSLFWPTPTPAAQPVTEHLAPGNLSIPSMNPAAQRVAQSLSGH